jgi:hypothetical protein
MIVNVEMGSFIKTRGNLRTTINVGSWFAYEVGCPPYTSERQYGTAHVQGSMNGPSE